MAVTYQDWLKSVKRFLATRRPDVRFDHLDPNHLHAAFQSGIAPIDFVQRGQFILSPAAPPIQTRSSNSHVALIAAVVVIGCLVSCIGVGLFISSAAEGARREMAAIPTCSQVQSTLHIGMSPQQVVDRIGEPHSVQEMNRFGLTTRYWYFNCRDGQVQLVFEYGSVLTSINRY